MAGGIVEDTVLNAINITATYYTAQTTNVNNIAKSEESISLRMLLSLTIPHPIGDHME